MSSNTEIKAIDVIEALKELITKHGNLPVIVGTPEDGEFDAAIPEYSERWKAFVL